MHTDAPASLTQIEAVCGATLRALAADASLQWSGQTLYQGTRAIALSAPHQQQTGIDLPNQRALLDGAALRLRWSNATLHAAHAPTEAVDALVFEWLEQLRVESLAPSDWPGVRANLAQHFLNWCQAFVDSGLTESSLGILLFTVAISVWSRLGSHEVPHAMADLAEATRANTASVLGGYCAALRRHRHDQQAFIAHALELSRWVGQAVSAAQLEATDNAAPRKRNGFSLNLQLHAPEPVDLPVATPHSSRSLAASAQRYRVFTQVYDREVHATSLVRKAQLAEFRAQMDDEVLQAGYNVARLARALQKGLAVPQADGWRFGQEAGTIDGSRLALLVSDPQERAVFKDPLELPRMQCAVSILLDCSGSMKAHARQFSILVDVLGRALEMAGVAVEILGFSTGAWNGGRARRDWQRAGRPELPGRLNEVLHMVFKSGTLPWRRARLGLAALRRPDLFREGVDGEALEWACQRLSSLPAMRRILLVVSDGCPMDSATAECNDEHYLAQHVQQLVPLLEARDGVAICALGVGLDLGRLYPNRLAVDLGATVDEALLHQVVALLCSPRRRRGGRVA